MSQPNRVPMNLSDVEMPSKFSGIVRLFPLPDLVLFPGVVQAIHIFEPRYRQMTRDLLADDQLVCICTCLDKIDAPLEVEMPRVCPTACISKIVAHRELPDGRFNLMAAGLKRATIIRELNVDQPYRVAKVRLIEDIFPAAEEAARLRAELLKTCTSIDMFKKIAQPADLHKLMSSNFHLGMLVDLISFTANLDCAGRLKILGLPDVGARCRRLIDLLLERSDTSHDELPGFPPNFSIN